MSDKERFGVIVPLFKAAIIDQLKQLAEATLSKEQKEENMQWDSSTPEERKELGLAERHIGTYQPSADGLKQAAFAAWNEIIESETEPIGPMLAVACWEALLKVNESAFRQGLERAEKAGTLGFKVGGGAKAPSTIAGGYLS